MAKPSQKKAEGRKKKKKRTLNKEKQWFSMKITSSQNHLVIFKRNFMKFIFTARLAWSGCQGSLVTRQVQVNIRLLLLSSLSYISLKFYRERTRKPTGWFNSPASGSLNFNIAESRLFVCASLEINVLIN